MTTLLIDGDILAYQVAAGIEKPIHWGNDLWTLHSDAQEGIRIMEEKLADLREKFEAERIVICLTHSENFRLSVLPTYKGNRKDVRKPICLKTMRDHLSLEYQTFERPGLEGDDCLGILATSQKITPGERIIVSIDKDMRTIPGNIYSKAGLFTVTEGQADFWHLFQTLTGDTTDGYSGCPGIGPANALKILGADEDWPTLKQKPYLAPGIDVSEAWPKVVKAFEKKGLGEEEALRQARVARILRVQDYDFKNRRPILWTPQ